MHSRQKDNDLGQAGQGEPCVSSKGYDLVVICWPWLPWSQVIGEARPPDQMERSIHTVLGDGSLSVDVP